MPLRQSGTSSLHKKVRIRPLFTFPPFSSLHFLTFILVICEVAHFETSTRAKTLFYVFKRSESFASKRNRLSYIFFDAKSLSGDSVDTRGKSVDGIGFNDESRLKKSGVEEKLSKIFGAFGVLFNLVFKCNNDRVSEVHFQDLGGFRWVLRSKSLIIEKTRFQTKS